MHTIHAWISIISESKGMYLFWLFGNLSHEKGICRFQYQKQWYGQILRSTSFNFLWHGTSILGKIKIE